MIDRKRMIRFVGFALIAWTPAALAVGFVAADAALWVAVVVLLTGIAAATAFAARVSRVPARMHPRNAGPDTPTDWTDMANPDGQYANRWASYADLHRQLATRDWTGADVAEIGGSNEVLRAMLPGARYRQLAYPEYDVQNLHSIADAHFDVVVLDQTLEHVVDPERALREVHRVLVNDGVAVVSTPFLVPVHEGEGYGDYYRWTPQGLRVVLERCGFEAEVRFWGNRPAAAALMQDMYMMTTPARNSGLRVDVADSDPEFPVTVWAVARKRAKTTR